MRSPEAATNRGGLLLVLCIALVACGAASGPEPPPEPSGDYGSWAARPTAEWPPITMINQIRYTDADHPTAACGFLLEVGDGVVAATAKHVLVYFKSKTMNAVSFGGSLTSWKMFPKNDQSRIAVLGELINEDPTERLAKIPSSRDWLLMTVEKRPEGMQPLRLRATPVEKGETVYVVGWRYPDEGPQHVHEGRFVRTEDGSVLIDVEALADNTIPGLSGSPVLDAHGHVIGLMSKKAGKLQRLAGVDYPMSVLRKTGRLDQD